MIYTYWNAGMNNAYWNWISDHVDDDIEKLKNKK
jgi:hypothetical protein